MIKQLAGQTMIYGLGRILSRLLHFVVIAAYLTRALKGDQEVFGMYVDIYFWMAVGVILIVHRMETTLFRFGSGDNRKAAYATASKSVAVLGIVICALVFLVADQIASLMHYSGSGRYIRYAALILFMDALWSVPMAKLRLENRAWMFAGLNVLNVLVTIICFLFFFEVLPELSETARLTQLIHYDESRLLDYVLISNLIASISLVLVLLPSMSLFSKSWDHALWRKMLRYCWPLVIVSLAGVVNQSVSAPLQKMKLSTDIEANMYWVGVFGACLKIAILLKLFNEAYNFAAEPFFFKRKAQSESRNIYGDATRAYAIVAACVLGLSLIFLPYLRYLIDSSYWEALFIVPPMFLAFYVLGLYYNFSIWYKLIDRTIIGAWIALSGAILTIVISWILLPRLGVIASVWASLIAYFSMSMICIVLGRKYFPISYPWLRLMIYPLVSFGVYYLSDYFLSGNSVDVGDFLLRMIFAVVLMTAFYFLEHSFIQTQLLDSSSQGADQ